MRRAKLEGRHIGRPALEVDRQALIRDRYLSKRSSARPPAPAGQRPGHLSVPHLPAPPRRTPAEKNETQATHRSHQPHEKKKARTLLKIARVQQQLAQLQRNLAELLAKESEPSPADKSNQA